MAMQLRDAHHFPEAGVPLFWPFALGLELETAALDESRRNLGPRAIVSRLAASREAQDND